MTIWTRGHGRKSSEHVVQPQSSFPLSTTWYLTAASLLHGQVEGVKHSGPTKLVLYFTGATNILYTFGDMLLLCKSSSLILLTSLSPLVSFNVTFIYSRVQQGIHYIA
ncbi:hypothetical protein ACS0TY_003247 [Phlomoides rotata]